VNANPEGRRRMEEQPQTVRELILSAALDQGIKIPMAKLSQFMLCVVSQIMSRPLPDAIYYCYKKVMGPDAE
jgi:hypothetical protein